MRFEDDSMESAKNVKQWNVKIISVSMMNFSSSWQDCYLVGTFLVYLSMFTHIYVDNLMSLQISKNKRHQDKAAALEVWERLEEFVRSRSHS